MCAWQARFLIKTLAETAKRIEPGTFWRPVRRLTIDRPWLSTFAHLWSIASQIQWLRVRSSYETLKSFSRGNELEKRSLLLSINLYPFFQSVWKCLKTCLKSAELQSHGSSIVRTSHRSSHGCARLMPVWGSEVLLLSKRTWKRSTSLQHKFAFFFLNVH